MTRPSFRRLAFSWVLAFAFSLGLAGCKPSRPTAATASQAQAAASRASGEKGSSAATASSSVALAAAVAKDIQRPVTRIIPLNSDALEALRLLDADDRVVGVFSGIKQESGLWPEKARLPQVGQWSEPNIEAIAQLKPDVVIHYARTAPHLEEKLAPFGIKVLRLDFFKVHTLTQEVALLGELLDKQAEADSFIAWHQGILDQVARQVAGLPKKATAYLENYSDYSAAGPGSGLQELCELAGCLNIAAGLDAPYPKIAPEWVVATQPDMILKIVGKVDGYLLQDASEYNLVRDRLLARPAWQHTAAAKNGRVYVVDGTLTSGPRVGIAVAYIAQWLYPQQMQTIQPDALHQEYLERFIKVPYRGRYFSDVADAS